MSAPFLVAVDFSSLTDRTIRFAVRQAEGSRGNPIDLLHVVSGTSVPTLGHPAAQDLAEQVSNQEERAAQQRLEQLMNTLVPEDLRRNAIVRKGPPWEVICSTAKRGYELVVVSTHGRTGLQHILLGSVAERVVRHSSIPVLVVR